MSEHDTPRNLGVEVEDLDGHTIEELSDYLDAGRTPPNSSIDQSPGCRIVLDALERLHALTPQLLAADTAEEPEPDESWVQNILTGIALDARAGRRIPITSPAAGTDLGITEGAVRGLIRAAENTVPGILVGACRFDGDVTVVGEPVRIRVDVSVPYGDPISNLAGRLREEISARIQANTTLNLGGIDITVQDIQHLPDRTEAEK